MFKNIKACFKIAKVIRSGFPFFYFPKNWQIKKRWLTAIKRQQHRDGFEMSVGDLASVLQETDVENEAQLMLAALSTAILDFVHLGLAFMF